MKVFSVHTKQRKYSLIIIYIILELLKDNDSKRNQSEILTYDKYYIIKGIYRIKALTVIGGKSVFNKRRSEIEIVEEILDISRDGAKKTEILYKSNMSFSQLKNYLSCLLEKNLIEESMVLNGNGIPAKIYVNTEKGNDLLGDINKIMAYFK